MYTLRQKRYPRKRTLANYIEINLITKEISEHFCIKVYVVFTVVDFYFKIKCKY